MKITIEMTPYEFLCNESWECYALRDKINDDNKDMFDEYVEEVFWDRIPTRTELNDFMRFEADEILDMLGIEMDE